MKPPNTPGKDIFSAAEKWVAENWQNPGPRPITYDYFKAFGGKTDALAQGYLYELTEKFGEKVPEYINECERLALITMRSLIGFENEISHAWLASVALHEGWIKSDLFGLLSEVENHVDFLDFMVLTYLKLALTAISRYQIRISLSYIFESSEAHRLCDHIMRVDEAQQSDRSVIVEFARKGADAYHDKPGGSREKRKKIQEIWMSGKFDKKDTCAREECDALGMSYSSARRALMGLPSRNDLPAG